MGFKSEKEYIKVVKPGEEVTLIEYIENKYPD